MLIGEVKKLCPLDRFLYWIRERHQIFLRRRAGKPKPWTDDEVLQRFFFTNPYRENDKVTQWFRENVREPLRNRPEVLFATVAFRWFNLPEPTGRILSTGAVNAHTNFNRTREEELLTSFLCRWDPQRVIHYLAEANDNGPIFTGAFMINSPPGEPKLTAIVRRITNVWNQRDHLIAHWNKEVTMESMHEALMTFDGMGGFMAYEVVCDLRYTYLLEHAPDKLTWCNPGPGAIRGLYRLAEEPFEKGNNSTAPPRPKDWQKRMQWLLMHTQGSLPKMPEFEMREIEHSLCEYDKYERALAGDGKMKRTYK